MLFVARRLCSGFGMKKNKNEGFCFALGNDSGNPLVALFFITPASCSSNCVLFHFSLFSFEFIPMFSPLVSA